MNSRLLAVLAVLVFAICLGAAWFLNSTPSPVVKVATPAPATSEPARARSEPFTTPASTTDSTTDEPAKVQVNEPVAPKQPAPAMTDSELRIERALNANVDETQTAQLLINMLPTLSTEGQEEAAQHISNLILDKDYNRVLPLVKNPRLPEEVLDVFVTDLMNREDEVKLPVLLDIAKIPNHPHREEAATDLEIFLDEEFGQDWAKWDAALKSYLKRQAEENAAAEKEAAAEAAANPR